MDVLYIYRFYTCRRSACIGVILSENEQKLATGLPRDIFRVVLFDFHPTTLMFGILKLVMDFF